MANLEDGLRRKARRTKYDYVNGGRAAWLAKIDSQPLGILTPETVTAWRNAYVAKAGSDPGSGQDGADRANGRHSQDGRLKLEYRRAPAN